MKRALLRSIICYNSKIEGESQMTSISQILSELQAQRKQAETELNRIDTAISALQGLGGKGDGSRTAGPRRRVMSAAARKRIADAQRARWAKWKAKQKKAA